MQESETVELKKSLAELKQGLVSIAAILKKHRAGTLWFGVCNDSIITGIDPGEKTLRDLSQSIVAHIEPKILRQSLLEKKAWFSKKPQRNLKETPKKLSSLS